MAGHSVPEKVRMFIYEYIDSVELLEILLLLSSDCSKHWSATSISQELRSSPGSIEKRLVSLERLQLIRLVPGSTNYFECVADQETLQLIHEIDSAYKVQRHRILELIFSPMKKARNFADSFKLGSKPKRGDSDG